MTARTPVHRELVSLEHRAVIRRKAAGRAWSRAAATELAGLPKQTVSGWFSEKTPRVPKDDDELWRLVVVYARWAGEQPDRAHWGDLLDRSRSVAKVDPGVPGLRPVRDWADPLALEVHPAIDGGAAGLGLPVLPEYVLRPHDDEPARAVADVLDGRSRFVVLVGGSSTGKTRACWEAVQRLPDRWRLWHPLDPGRPEALAHGLDQRVRSGTVVWLNELQFYLDTPDVRLGERVAAGLQEVVRGAGPVLVLATIWPEHWWTLTTPPRPGTPDRHAQARMLLAGATVVQVPDRFGDTELAALKASGDPRIALAGAAAARGRVTQFLAGAPALVLRYRNAPAPAKAVLHAAIDLNRFGFGSDGIDVGLLERAAALYLDPDEDPGAPEWFAGALAALCVPVPGGQSPLRVTGSAVRMADYLDQVGRRDRAKAFPGADFFDLLLDAVGAGGRLSTIADRLNSCGRLLQAARFYGKAFDVGKIDSVFWLASLLEMAGDFTGTLDVLERGAAAGDQKALDYLVQLLFRRGDHDRVERECLRHFDLGNPRPLVELHIEVDESNEHHFAEVEAKILRANPRGLPEERNAVERLALLAQGLNGSIARMRESIDRLDELVAGTGDESRRETGAAKSTVDELVAARRWAEAKRAALAGVDAGLLGVEVLEDVCEKAGDAGEAEAVRCFGLTPDGAISRPWGYADVKA